MNLTKKSELGYCTIKLIEEKLGNQNTVKLLSEIKGQNLQWGESFYLHFPTRHKICLVNMPYTTVFTVLWQEYIVFSGWCDNT